MPGGDAVRCVEAMKRVDRIVADLEPCGGHPRVEGARSSVFHVLGWLASGMSAEAIFGDYLQLTPEDIRARLACGAAITDGLPAVAAEKIIVDENLPWRVAALISPRGHSAQHVS